MLRLVAYLVAIALIATGLAWLADRPGTIEMQWQGYAIETTVFRATVILAAIVAASIFAWSILKTIWNSPSVLGQRVVRRREKRGIEALSGGLIAIGSGDGASATRYALQARKSLPHEPLTHLLRAQAAQLSGDRATSRRIFEAMLAAPETEQLGLRGLFLEAQREGANEAARQFAERALRANPKLDWSTEALFDLQCKQKEWSGALETLALSKRHGHIDKAVADRRRAVLLAGLAQDAEDSDTEKALTMALEAHALASDLIPAAAVAGRILAARGNTSKASKIIQKTWARAPHPDLATAYAYARIGDSPRDRLNRIRQLAALNPHTIESPIAVANTAIEARLFDEAREALEPLLGDRLTQRVATLMARVEAGEHGDKGRVREWLARAVTAGRDPVWTADGVLSDRWEPISPVTGTLDAYEWRVPVENIEPGRASILADRFEELMAIGAPATMADRGDDAASAPLDVTPATSSAKAADGTTKGTPPAAERGRNAGRWADAVDADAVTIRPDAAARSAPARAPSNAQQASPQSSPASLPASIAATSKAAASAPAVSQKEKASTTPAPSVQPAAAGARDAATPTPGSAPGAKAEPSKTAASAKSQPGEGRQSGTAKPDAKIFVAPRAPDDPGLDDTDNDPEPAGYPKRAFRAVN